MEKQLLQTAPIVQQDLSREETILQIAFSFEVLEKLATNIFADVRCAIEKKKIKLQNIQSRCDATRQKVEKLANIKRSIKVFSCYKYPGPMPELFYKIPERNPVDINEPNIKIKCSGLPLDKCSLKEKLKFYHVRNSTQAIKKNCETVLIEGLGSFPSECSKVHSILLYNTNHNLYKHYKIVDPLCTFVKQCDSSLNNDKHVSEPDPISIGASEHLGFKSIHNYFYSPSVQDVPDIEAPLNLPRLTGIAGDLRYCSEHINKESSPPVKEEVFPEEVELPTNQSLNVPAPVTQVLPPPPPLPPAIPCFTPEDQEDLQVKNEEPISSDARANLMEAIRQAGGKKKLKHVSHEKSEQKVPQGKSLMDDLHAKLHMRRKGISGKVDNTDGMLDRIVAMIPLPPAPLKQPDPDDDQDWDD